MKIFQVDAFVTECAFSGNPAAVCPLDSWIEDELLQGIAASNNLSETAFFVPKDSYFELRWFTPNFEIDLCGHATLASAHVLFNHLSYPNESIYFKSFFSGDLFVEKQDDLILLDFPSKPAKKLGEIDSQLIKGLGIEVQEVYQSRDYMVVLPSEKDVLSISPNYYELSKLKTLGVIVTAPGANCVISSQGFYTS